MRGSGQTTYEPQDGWSGVDDVLAVLDAAGAERPLVVACSAGGWVAIDLTLAHPDRVGGLALIGTAVSGAPYPDIEGQAAALNTKIEAAQEAGDLDDVNRLEAWMWLDGPLEREGRVSGPARELFLDMNGQLLRTEDPGEEAELIPAWPRLSEISVPTLVLVGRLDVHDIKTIDEQAAAMIPGVELRILEGVAHQPHLEGDPATLELIAAFADANA